MNSNKANQSRNAAAASAESQSPRLLDEVREQFYAISHERRIKHPAVEAGRSGMRKKIFR